MLSHPINLSQAPNVFSFCDVVWCATAGSVPRRAALCAPRCARHAVRATLGAPRWARRTPASSVPRGTPTLFLYAPEAAS